MREVAIRQSSYYAINHAIMLLIYGAFMASRYSDYQAIRKAEEGKDRRQESTLLCVSETALRL